MRGTAWLKAARDRAAIATDVNNIFTSGPRCTAPRLSAFCSFAARKNEFFRSVTPVSKSPFECTTTATARRDVFVRGTGNSAVFRLRSSRIGRNGLVAESRSVHLPTCARACISTAQKGSLSSRLWPWPSSFPAFDTPFRVAACARPEKIYRLHGPRSRPPNVSCGRKPRAHRSNERDEGSVVS